MAEAYSRNQGPSTTNSFVEDIPAGYHTVSDFGGNFVQPQGSSSAPRANYIPEQATNR